MKKIILFFKRTQQLLFNILLGFVGVFGILVVIWLIVHIVDSIISLIEMMFGRYSFFF